MLNELFADGVELWIELQHGGNVSRKKKREIQRECVDGVEEGRAPVEFQLVRNESVGGHGCINSLLGTKTTKTKKNGEMLYQFSRD